MLFEKAKIFKYKTRVVFWQPKNNIYTFTWTINSQSSQTFTLSDKRLNYGYSYNKKYDQWLMRIWLRSV